MTEAPQTPVLKQMTVVQILDASFRLYRENFALFLGIMAVPFVPVIVCMIGSQALLMTSMPDEFRTRRGFGEMFGAMYGTPSPQEPNITSDQLMFIVILSLVMILFTLLLYVIAIPIARGALTRAVSDRYLGKPATFGQSYRAVLSIFWRYLGTTFLTGMIVGLGFVLCCVPGIILFTMFAFVPMIMVLEGLSGTDSMGRSKDLSTGHRGRVFGLAVITFIVNMFLGSTLSILFDVVLPLIFDSPILLQVLSMASGQVLQLLLEPIFTLAFILLYYDVRIRKEAFDLQLLAMRTA